MLNLHPPNILKTKNYAEFGPRVSLPNWVGVFRPLRGYTNITARCRRVGRGGKQPHCRRGRDWRSISFTGL